MPAVLRAGFIGAGHIAQLHSKVLRDLADVELVAVADPDLRRAEKLALGRDGCRAYGDPLEMLEMPGLDAVHVLVPPASHASLVEAAIRRGCHVLVEKPLTTSVAKGRDLYRRAEEAGVRLCVNHNYLFEPLIRRAVGLVEDEEIGEVVSAEASLRFDLHRYPALLAEGAEHEHWTFDLPGGPLHDLMPHPVSMVLHFLGDRVDSVSAERLANGRLPGGFADEIRVLVRGGRCLGVVGVSLGEKPDTFDLRIGGSDGSVTVDLYTNTLIVHRPSGLPRAVSRASSGLNLSVQRLRGVGGNLLRAATGRLDRTGGIGPLVTAFYDSIRAGASPPISAENALGVVRVIESVWGEGAAGPERVQRPEPEASVRPDAPLALVTGASGFIGSHLVSELSCRGYRVRALVRPNSPNAGRLSGSPVEMIRGDLADAGAIRSAAAGADLVFHLGGAVGNDWQEHEVTTIEATRILLEASLEENVRGFVYVSTLALCDTGAVADGEAVTEEVPNASELGPYARAKQEAERLVHGAVERGLSATIVRPGIVVGPRGRILFPHIGYGVGDKLFVVLGKGDSPLPITYVANTVDALRRAADSPERAGEVYHVVDDDQVTPRAYLERLIRTAQLPARIVHVPFWSAWAGAAAYELAALLPGVPGGLVSREQLRQKRAAVRFDCSKAKRELGWRPTVPLEEGLDETFEWYRERRA